MGVLSMPLALLGLLGLPVLGGIYLLRSRPRRQVISTLMLWADQKQSPTGGRTVQRPQLPLLLLLELLAVALGVLAAAGPHLARGDVRAPLIVVLNDSYSMRAGPRDKALATLASELRSGRHSSVEFIAAGPTPRLMGAGAVPVGSAMETLEQWRCSWPTADMPRALALAREIAPPHAQILAICDTPPPGPPAAGVRWLALGEPLGNVAIVNAVRGSRGGEDRCLLEIANFSPATVSLTLTVDNAGTSTHMLDIEPGATERVAFAPADPTAAVTARIDRGGALEIDDSVTLLPEDPGAVRVHVDVGDPLLRALVERACQASELARLSDLGPELIITDSPAAPNLLDAEPFTWILRVLAGEGGAAYVGPFIIDRAHPLSEGLSLDGAIWGAAGDAAASGAVVVAAGDVPLLSEHAATRGRREIRVGFVPELSNFQHTPNWPILLHNVLAWRGSAGREVNARNARLGQTLLVTPRDAVEQVSLRRGDGSTERLRVTSRRAAVTADSVGMHVFDIAGRSMPVAVNALSPAGSDLSGCGSGRWGTWRDQQTLATRYHSLAWLAMLLAMAALTLHGAVVWAQGRRRPS